MKARVIVTNECALKCPGCCNEIASLTATPIMSILDLLEREPKGWPTELIITGGEPLLNERTRGRVLRMLASAQRVPSITDIWLYTAWWNENIIYMLPYLSGITFTLHHEPHNLSSLWGVQRSLTGYLRRFGQRHQLNNRLRVDSRVPAKVVDSVWSAVQDVFTEMKLFDWIDTGERPLPPDEELFILKGGWD